MMRQWRGALALWVLGAACDGEPASATTTTSLAPEAAPLRTIRLALNWYPEPEFGGFYAAQLSGAYREAGFDVEILPGGPGAPSLELLATGQVEAAITAADELLVKRHRGIRAVAAFPAFQINPAGIMVHAQSGAKALADIQDGRIAIEIGSPMQAFLWQTQGWEGKVEPIPYGGAVGPFLADPAARQQAYITSEPCIARARGAEVEFLRAADAGWNPYAALLAFPEPLPEWAPAFVAASRKGWEQYLADPGPANSVLVGLNAELGGGLIDCVTEAQRPFLTGEDGLGAMTSTRWQATHQALVRVGVLPEGTSPEGAWVHLP